LECGASGWNSIQTMLGRLQTGYFYVFHWRNNYLFSSKLSTGRRVMHRAKVIHWHGLEGVKLYAFVQAGACQAVYVVAQGFGAGNVAVDLRLGFARNCGGFGCKGFGLRPCAAVTHNLRWRKLRHLKIGNPLSSHVYLIGWIYKALHFTYSLRECAAQDSLKIRLGLFQIGLCIRMRVIQKRNALRICFNRQRIPNPFKPLAWHGV
jgi:hypothetical protein